LVSLLRKWTYGRLDAVVSQSGESAEWLQRRTNARRLPVIFNPLSVPVPRTSPVLNPAAILEPSTKTLLAAGRLVPQKGFDRLLRAFARVAPGRPEWRLVIAGIGPLRLELEALAGELGIVDKVKMLGRVGNMGDWYEAADAFALTSLFEGFPNVLCEAMAYGLPCVSVDCDTGPRSIIKDGHDGLLVRQDDPQALAATLDTVMGDAALRRRLGENARAIRSRLSLSGIAWQWELLFEDLLGRKSRGRAVPERRGA
jgi:glycosyltransferase involved in cell wall biosynthesis